MLPPRLDPPFRYFINSVSGLKCISSLCICAVGICFFCRDRSYGIVLLKPSFRAFLLKPSDFFRLQDVFSEKRVCLCLCLGAHMHACIPHLHA